MAVQQFDLQALEAQLFEKISQSKATTVNGKLGEIRDWFLDDMAPEQMAKDIRNAIQEVVEAKIEETALKTQVQAPDFSLPNANGELISLSETLKKSPVVLVFYRGAWCPYCNIYLGGLAQMQEEFSKRGVSVLAVSPQTPEMSAGFTKERQFPFEVLSDVGNKVAKDYKLVYQLSDYFVDTVFPQFGITLSDFNGDKSNELALPATYVIDQKGVTQYAFTPANYTQRAEYSEIFEALDKLK